MTNRYTHICLVNSPLNLSVTSVPSTGSLAPLGLLSLATYLEAKFPSIEIDIVDGDLLGFQEAKRRISSKKYDLVGIGVQAAESYSCALSMAKIAKENGSLVIFGGEQATIRAQQILSNRKDIDFVAQGQGESCLAGLVLSDSLEKIPNLVYRKEGVIVENPKIRLPLNTLPIPKRKFVDQEDYALQFQKTLESKLTGFKSFVTIRTQDGCMKAIRQGVCSFCVRDDLFMAGFRRPEIFWKEIDYLQGLGIDYAWDIAASFASVGPIYLKKLADTKPSHLNLRFRVYARADDLANIENVDALARIGIENVLVGFDSGSQRCLDSANKRTTLEQHKQAARNLRAYNIATYAAFVLGYLVETEQSMLDTLHHANELKEILGEKLYRAVTCSKMQLYPTSGEWNAYMASNSAIKERYEQEDLIDNTVLTRGYFQNLLHLDVGRADEIAKQIRSLAPIRSGKDIPKEFTLS